MACSGRLFVTRLQFIALRLQASLEQAIRVQLQRSFANPTMRPDQTAGQFSLAAQIYEVIRFHDELAGAIYSGNRTTGFQFLDFHAVDSDSAADGSQRAVASVGFGAAIDAKFDFKQRDGDANPIHAQYNDARAAGPDRETADRTREKRWIEQPHPLGLS
jgi:hypothetical protein